MDNRLIFDIGTHIGEDTHFYLSKGYKVIAIDADPATIEANKKKFSGNSDVTFLNYAISDTDGQLISLFVNEDSSKNSLFSEIGGRQDSLQQVVQVPTRTLSSLMQEYGVPFYCKIDIEGYDPVAIRSIRPVKELPRFTSAETECKPDEARQSEDGIFDALDALKEVGYTKFKLVDQTTLMVLDNRDFYKARSSFAYKLMRKLQKLTGSYTAWFANKQRLSKKYNYSFVHDATGPFGDELEGDKWMSYEEAKALYLFHRRSYYSIEANKNFGMWADWHATY